MKKRIHVFGSIILVLFSITLPAAAEEDSIRGCMKDVIGSPICAPPGGSIAQDILGSAVCGAGQCIKDVLGAYQCSSQQSGYATKNILGSVVCTGGCQAASAATCLRPS